MSRPTLRVLALAAAALATSASAAPLIELASRGAFPAPLPSNGQSFDPRLSADGRYVVFTSQSTSFGVPDTNRTHDIYVYDRTAATFALLSRSGVTQGNGPSTQPAISADAARIAFASGATNFAAGDTNGVDDIFVLERVAGTLRRLVPAAGVEPNGASGKTQISSNGRYVAFETLATNWFAGDTNGAADVVVYDLVTDTAVRATIGNAGEQPAELDFGEPSFALSANGRCVAFATSTPMQAGEVNAVTDVYLRDLDAATTIRVSTGTAGEADSESQHPWVSPDCTRVAFTSYASNLVAAPAAADAAVYERTLAAGTTARLWPAAGAPFASLTAANLRGSYNGEYLVFAVVGVPSALFDFESEPPLARWRRSDGMTTLSPATLTGFPGAISDDGAFAAYQTDRPVVTNDRNARTDVALFDAVGLSRIAITIPPAPVVASSANGSSGVGDRTSPLMQGQFRQQFVSDDGLLVGFSSIATNLVASGDDNAAEDVFVFDRRSGTNTRITRGLGGAEANGDSSLTDMTSDGRFLVIESCATNLVPGDTNGLCDVFVTDRTVAPITFERVNLGPGGVQADQEGPDVFGGQWGSISADGRYVAFVSQATNLVAGDTNAKPDLFMRDRVSGTTMKLTQGIGGIPAGGQVVAQPKISADGRWVSFRSNTQHLASVPPGNRLWVVDTTTLAYEVVNVTSDEVPFPAGSSRSFISADGRYVAFVGLDGGVPGDNDGQPDVFIRDRLLGKTTLASLKPDGTSFTELAFVGGLSARGNILPFIVDFGGVVGGAGYAYDISTGRVDLIYQNTTTGTQALRPAASGNGRYIAVANSEALLPIDQNGLVYDIYTASNFITGIDGGAEGASPELALAGAATADAEMGEAVAISDRFVVAGAPGINQVYVYERPAGATGTGMLAVGATEKAAKAFNLVATLAAPGGGALGDKWGAAVAISPDGNVIAIGAPGVGAGQVAVFQRPAGGWTSTSSADQSINAPSAGPDVVVDDFGTAIDIGVDGRMVIGAPMTDVFGAPDAGVVAVYAPQAGNTYAAQGTPMAAPTAQAGAAFGSDVAITPNAIAVGAPLENDGGNVDEGAVYTYGSNGGDPYTVSATIRPPDGGGSFDKWGAGVGLGPNTLVIGAPGNDAAGTDSGAGFVYQSPNNTFGTTTPSVLMPERTTGGEAVGTSVEVAGDYVVIGAPLADRLNVGDTGTAFVFERPELGWQTRAQFVADIELRASEAQAGQEFGDAVAVTAQGLVIGVPQRDVGVRQDQGEADTFVFDRIIRAGFE